ncbi:MAG TPA: hypothetical protein VFG69_14025 [Nannocystaceae bacterium]|nr:hypothetical protein [Nannocystaceae bacterium]
MKKIGFVGVLCAIAGCDPLGGADGDESAAIDTGGEGEEAEDGESGGDGDANADEPAVLVEITGALLLSSEGAVNRTSIAATVEVSNLGVAPITALQLRAFTFAGHWSRSSIVVDPMNLDEALPLAPGDTATLRFSHEEDGALFDCAAWDGPRDTEVRLSFAVDDVVVHAPGDGHIRCRIVD